VSGWRLALRLARRGVARSGRAGVAVYLLLVAAVAAVTAGPVAHRSLLESAREQARALLGGDLLLEVTGTPLDGATLAALLPEGARVATVAHLMTFARAGGRTVTVSLEAVDAGWPLVGRLETRPAGDARAALAAGRVWAEPALLARLGLRPGDTLRLGPRRFTLAGTLERQPDRLAGGLALGPRVLVDRRFLEDTPLLGPAAFVRWRHAVLLPAGMDVEAFAAALRARGAEARFRVRTAGEMLPRLARVSGRLGTFAGLAALALLVLGGLGLHLAVRTHARLRRHPVAVLRALGAEARLLDRWLLLECLLLLAAAATPGLLLGIALPALLLPLATAALPLEVRLHLAPADLLAPLGVAVGMTVAAVLPPLAASRRTPAARLFRSLGAPMPPAPAGARLLAAAALVLAAAAAVVAQPDPGTGLAAVVVLAASVGLLIRGGHLLVRLARARAAGGGSVRGALAWRILAAPDAATIGLVTALGLAVALATAALPVAQRLRAELTERLPARAAALFLLDIRPEQRLRLGEILARHGATLLQEAPVVRARVVRIRGVPVTRATIAEGVRWTVRADRVVTWRREVLPDDRLRAGRWWAPDHDGPPLVAVEGRVAEGYGLSVGDTLTFNVLGRTLTATVAAIRPPVDWTRGRLDFVFVLSPGVLEGTPHAWIAAVDVPAAREAPLLAELAEALPGVSAVPMREVVARLREAVDGLGRILLAVGLLVAMAALVVVAASVRAGEAERRRQLLVLRAVGATRGELTALWLRAFTALGAVAALPGAVLGTLLAALATVAVFRLDPAFPPWTLLLPATVAVIACALVGILATRRLLTVPVGRLFAEA